MFIFLSIYLTYKHEQWKNPGCLGIVGEYATQLYGDYFINRWTRIPIKQPVCQWKVSEGLNLVAHMDPSWAMDGHAVDGSAIPNNHLDVNKNQFFFNGISTTVPSTGEWIPDFWLPSTKYGHFLAIKNFIPGWFQVHVGLHSWRLCRGCLEGSRPCGGDWFEPQKVRKRKGKCSGKRWGSLGGGFKEVLIFTP